MNPFDKSFEAEYELAIKQGNNRFGSECKHEHVKNGHCTNCLRKVWTVKDQVAYESKMLAELPDGVTVILSTDYINPSEY